MSKWIITAAVLAAVVGGYGAYLVTKPPTDTQRASLGGMSSGGMSSHSQPEWTDAAWPFPIDQWGQGWAYQCKAADCGVEVNVYLRPKIGFCNCLTGVADDEELDRVGDVDLVGGESSALGPGQPIVVHGMKGRSRGYAVAAGSAKSVLSIAFNNRCDVIVATVVAGDQPVAQEQAVLEFLNGDLVLHWAEVVLGL